MAIRPWINGLSLYTGGGGLEAGLHIVFKNYRTVCAVERQAYAAAAFVEWMEKTGMGACPVWDDVTTFDPVPWRDCVDIVSAGFPCQPHSHAGKGLGEHDPRYGWTHVSRIIRGLMPTAVVLENVAALLARGYDRVKRNLEGLGYTVAEGIYSAAEVGAPHLRERLFVVGVLADAYSGFRARQPRIKGRGSEGGASSCRSGEAVADATRLGRPEPEGQQGRSDASFSGSGLGDADDGAERAGLRQSEAEEIGIGRSCDADGKRWPWPAGRGAEQYEWEKPRLVESGMGGTAYGVGARNEQLYLLGNGVAPVAAAMAVVDLWDKLKRGA